MLHVNHLTCITAQLGSLVRGGTNFVPRMRSRKKEPREEKKETQKGCLAKRGIARSRNRDREDDAPPISGNGIPSSHVGVVDAGRESGPRRRALWLKGARGPSSPEASGAFRSEVHPGYRGFRPLNCRSRVPGRGLLHGEHPVQGIRITSQCRAFVEKGRSRARELEEGGETRASVKGSVGPE